jgi:Tol biopolymer transport system component
MEGSVIKQALRMVVIVAIASGVTLSRGVLAQTSRTAEMQLKAAQHQEEVEGDLKGAIEQYKKLAQSNNRAIAAKALIQMAGCYQRLGDAEAWKTYEQVVKYYPDQKEAVALARARLSGSAVTANTGAVTRQVWTGPNVDTYGSVSPDGRILSFTDWSTGNLALHDLATGQDRRLTNKKDWTESEYAIGSAISRDGRQVAYGWLVSASSVPAHSHFADVRLIDLSGGRPRVLFTSRDMVGVYVHDWSPDGKWLATSWQKPDQTVQISLVSTIDGTLRILKSVDWRGVSGMAFSPDGKYLAYDLSKNADSEAREIHLLAVDGSRDTPALAHSDNDRVLGWSPDAKHLLFASDHSGSSGIWMLPVTDGTPQGEPKLIKANVNPKSMGVTRSGALYYGINASLRGIYVASVDFETGKVLSPPAIIPTPYAGLTDFPQWSRDGKYLAYLSKRESNTRSGQMTTLAIRSIETGKVRELMPDLAYLYSAGKDRPLWTPDGNFVVTGVERNGRQGVYRIDAQNGQTVPLVISDPAHGSLSARALSADGRTLYIKRSGGDLHEEAILARDIASGKEREMVRRSSFGDTVLSPDGRLLATTAFDSTSKSPSSLMLVPTDGGQPRELLRVSDPEYLGAFVAWSPDGKFLLFRKFPKGATRREPWRISVDGGAAREIDLNGVFGRDPSIHPDGHQIAFVSGEATLEIWTLENFLPASSAKSNRGRAQGSSPRRR